MSALPETQVLQLNRQGFVLTATIDDPRTRNSMSDALVGDLEAVLDATEGDRTLRALVLRSAGGVFCAGADLKNVDRDTPPGQRDASWRASERGGRLFQRLNAHPQAVVAVVEGAAVGGGFGLTCCADLVICSTAAWFALSETSVGLVPAQIAPFVLARIGAPAMRRLSLTAARVDAAAALEIGLADYVAAPGDPLEQTVQSVLNGVGRCAPKANAATKALILACSNTTPADYVSTAADVFTSCVRDAEGVEGIAAFREKRPASWVEKA